MGKDDSTWLNLSHVLFFIAIAYLGAKAIETLGIQFGWVERYDWYENFKIVGGGLFGAAAAWWLRSSSERMEYHLSAVAELRKVTWPTFEETKRMTIIVAVVVFIFAIILAIFDYAWSHVLQLILQ